MTSTNDGPTNWDDSDDIEEMFAEARAGITRTPAENWAIGAELATLILQRLPGSRVSCGQERGRTAPVDYITPQPNPPLVVFSPDGRFIVSFTADGTWIEASGRGASSLDGILEGTPGTVAELLIRIAGVDMQPVKEGKFPRQRHVPGDGLRRLQDPVNTDTWRDRVTVPRDEAWDASTPPSICRSSATSRIILAPYDPESCTFAGPGYRQTRWGVESLRIPVFPDSDTYSPTWSPTEPIHGGDCLVTVGPKFVDGSDQLGFESDLDGELMWHPQLVLRAEPEGQSHVRVWLAVDDDVRNDHATPDELDLATGRYRSEPRVLERRESMKLLEHFQLDVFCPECGSRGKPIVYGMPGPDEPDYLAIGGCIIQPEQPLYVCPCGHEWGSTDF